MTPPDYTAMCARLDRISAALDSPFATTADSAAIRQAAAAIRELEARARESAMQELASLGQAQEAYEAQLAAEAKLAEVEKERDELRYRGLEAINAYENRLTAAEATVATLTAQVEAMRGALEKIETLDNQAECCGVGVQNGFSAPECCCQPLYGLDRAKIIARAALTTENQTND